MRSQRSERRPWPPLASPFPQQSRSSDVAAPILQAINGISLGGAAVPAGERLHADVRPDARRQHGLRRILSARRLCRLCRSRARTGSFELAILGGGLPIVVLGYFVDRFLIRPLGSNHLAQVLLTVGVAFVIGEVCLAIWGGDNLQDPDPVLSARLDRAAGRPLLSEISLRADPVRHVRGAVAVAALPQDPDRRGGARRRRRPRDGERDRHQRRSPVRAGVGARLVPRRHGRRGRRRVPHAQSGRRMGHSGARAGGRDHRRPRQPRRRDPRQHHRRPARCLWPLAAAGVLLLRAVRSDGDPAAVPGTGIFGKEH